MTDQPVQIERPGEAQQLLHEIEHAIFIQADVTDLRRALESSIDVFLNLLDHKRPDPATRRLIESGTVNTLEGFIVLDAIPDIREIKILSDELDLNELLALGLVLAGQEQSQEVAAAAAGGIFYDERFAAATSLLRLLHAQVVGAIALPPSLYATIAGFNAKLLQIEDKDGHTTMLRRLADLIHAGSLPLAASTQIPLVTDAYGRALSRADVVARECTTLCHCLLYVVCIKQRLSAVDIRHALQLLHHLALHAGTQGQLQSAAQHQANLVLLVILLTFLPLEDAQVQDEATADDAALRGIAQDSSIDQAVRSLPLDQPYGAVIRLAWGILPFCCAADALTSRAVKDVEDGLRSGALGFLADGLIGSGAMAEEDADIRGISASIVNQLLVLFVDVAHKGLSMLKKNSLEGAATELGAPSNGVASKSPPTGDSLYSLLRAFARTLDARPALFQDESRRSPVIGELMGDIGYDAGLANVPSVFLGYVDVLTALASGEGGARLVFLQLRGDAAPLIVSWPKMLGALLAVVRMYSDGPDNIGSTGLPSQRTAELVLPATDTSALCAFAGLFARVMEEGAQDEVAAWVRQLDDDAGVSPFWEVLFQAMCTPVPQSLKAALDRAIAALAARQPALAAALWDRLLAAVVVRPVATGALVDAVPLYDLTFQVNEIESRAEDYVEAVAFVELLNALWRSGGKQLADSGRAVAHLTRFVCEDLLGTIFQRIFRFEEQRWLLLSACLDHCRLTLEVLPISADELASDISGSNRPPGLNVLLDLVNESSTMKAVLVTLCQGVDRLTSMRRSSSVIGSAQESAVLAALRLLNAGFTRDVDFAAAARASLAHGSFETLDGVLRHDRSRTLTLLEYVRYSLSPAIQEEALRFAGTMTSRSRALVQQLLTVTAVGEDHVPVPQRLQESFAACLHDSVSEYSAEMLGSSQDDGNFADERSALSLDLLLGCLEEPTPNMTQLLCGFDVAGGRVPLALVDPRAAHTPLRVVMDVLMQPRCATTHARVFEQCLQLVYELARDANTGPATLSLLHGYYRSLLPLLTSVAVAPIPVGVDRASSLHQRAWLLQLVALELHQADPAVKTQCDSLRALLSSLFVGDHLSIEMSISRPIAMDVLAIAVNDVPPEPQLGPSVCAETRRMLQTLDVDALLAAEALRATGIRGDALVNVLALKDELLSRYNDWIARHGPPPDAFKEAGRAALAYAAEFNAYSEEMGGRAALLTGWQALATVAFSRRFDILSELVGGVSATIDLCMTACEESLAGIMVLLTGPGAPLASPLGQSLQTLTIRLQEQVAEAATADPLAGLPLPSRCHALLEGLLTAMWEGRAQESVRLSLYHALCSYFVLCRGPSLLQAPPSVVSTLFQHTGGAEQLDAVQLSLEEGNVAVLHVHTRILPALMSDALSPNPTMAVAALVTLSALLAADPSAVLCEEIHEASLPSRVLADISDTPPSALVAPAPAGQAIATVLEAKLGLLLRLALAGPPSHRTAAVQRLFVGQTISRLRDAKIFDVQLEEPGLGVGLLSTQPVRHRLHALLCPVLRLVLVTLTTLSHSSAVKEQVGGFVGAHARTLSRVLRDAAYPGLAGWAPSDAELEQASLVAELLAELGANVPRDAAPVFAEAGLRACCQFLAPSARSQSLLVVRLEAKREAGPLPREDQLTYGLLLELRCALVAYLRALTQAGLVRLSCAPMLDAEGDLSLSSHPSLCLLKDALVQAAVRDLPVAVENTSTIMRALRSGDPRAVEDAVRHRDVFLAAGPPKGQLHPAEARAILVRAATARETEISRLLLLIEQLLALIYCHVRTGGTCLQLGGDGVNKPLGHPVGSQKDWDQLRRLLEPAIAALERMLGEGVLPVDRVSFELVLRRTKEGVAAAAGA